MQAGLVPRRTQFSSCDACRKSRVACDAVRARAPTSVTGPGPCSRCANRSKACTFEWMKKAANRTSRRTLSNDRLPTSPTTSILDQSVEASSLGEQSPASNTVSERIDDDDSSENRLNRSVSPPAISTSAEVAEWLRTMYEEGFEAVFGSWLGNYSCPYVFGEHCINGGGPRGQSSLSLCVSISSLCTRFDQWMKELEVQSRSESVESTSTDPESQKAHQIDDSLTLAMRTFSARWLPLTLETKSDQSQPDELVEVLWRQLRKELLKVINRPCYRSVLTLFLFAMTPIPVGIQEDEEENGIPAQFCVQAALQQVQHLRARQRSLEFNGSKVSPIPDPAVIASSPNRITADFIDIESIIYWAALTFDTSASLTFNMKSLLSAGLLGWESEPSWRLVKTCTDMFHEQTEDWRIHGLNVNEENANRIIAAASAWKLLVWKLGAVLKEALREGKEDDAVHRTFARTVDAIEQFNMTYRGLLVACERHIQFLGQLTKLRWYELMLHYHLCILIIIDAIEIARRDDLLEQMKITRADAEGSVINCLAFGLNNFFIIPRRGSERQDSVISVPLVAIDPYTHHVVAAVQLLRKAIHRDYEGGKIGLGTLENLQAMLLKTLELLPRTSKSVRNAKLQLELSSFR